MAGVIRVGISAWTEPTLIKAGTFYPQEAKTAEDRLRFYAERFPIVEVDSTYYALPAPQTARRWVERTPRDFTFDAKAFALLTQHPSPAARVPKDIRERLAPTAAANLYFKDLGARDRELIWDRFREGLQPLRDAGKLGAVLFQFPKWFLPSPASYRFMEDLREWLPDFRLAIEFRQAAWMREDRRARVLDFLRGHDLTYVAVDEPQGFSSSVPPVVATTAPLAMIRFHGRNRETWEKQNITTAERFKYLYDKRELAEWVPRIEAMAEQAQEVHAIFNNCYADYSVRNAADLAELLS